MWYQRKVNKYGNKNTHYNGRSYDSRHEARIAIELNLLQKAGEVIKVIPQKTYQLYGKGGNRICSHRPDFTVTLQDGHQEVWEAKGFATQLWQLKLKLFEDNYPDIIYYVITPRERFYGSKKRYAPTYVLVQREMESGRSPLASIAPFRRAGLRFRRRWGLTEGQRLKLASKRKSG